MSHFTRWAVPSKFIYIFLNKFKIHNFNLTRTHTFKCNLNGVWEGEWPVCMPKITCPKENITTGLPSSITIENIGNVYYINETTWYAIEHSWVRYACAHFEGIMVGKGYRACLGGKWSNKIPKCTQGMFKIYFKNFKFNFYIFVKKNSGCSVRTNF